MIAQANSSSTYHSTPVDFKMLECEQKIDDEVMNKYPELLSRITSQPENTAQLIEKTEAVVWLEKIHNQLQCQKPFYLNVTMYYVEHNTEFVNYRSDVRELTKAVFKIKLTGNVKEQNGR